MRGLFILVLTTIFVGLAAPFIAATKPQTIIINAHIYQHADADMIVIKNGKINAIDNQTNIDNYDPDNAQIIDAEGGYILPGFIDNHNHVFEAMSEVGGTCSLPAEVGLNRIIAALKLCKANAPPNSWVMGYGFALEDIIELPGLQAAQIINQIFPNQPVVIVEQTSHSVWANDVALKRANIAMQFYDDQAISFMLLDWETLKPTGILFDQAADALMDYAWNAAENTQQLSYVGLLDGLAEVAANGITTIGDGRLYWQRGWWDVWQKVAAEGALTARVSVRPWVYPDVDMATQLDFFKQIYNADTSKLLIVDQAKFYADGIVINGTAKTKAAYFDTYIPDYPYGLDFFSPAALRNWLSELSKIGYGAHIHAIGDAGVANALDAISQQTPKTGINYTISHVELVDKADIARFEQLNITADFQIGHDDIANNDHAWAVPFLGETRAQNFLDIGAIYNTGANISLSSDWDVYPLNPLVGIKNSLKMGAKGLPNIDAAIAAYTINAAKSLGLDDITGSITIGKSADFVLLDADITQLKIADIDKAQILMSILQGNVVFVAE
ncbi:MAG: amidohydrolase [Rhizobiales bacterium]|nr:amidohydrolase [Hyphomicrobiales bacterium]NRB13572.1 amidohydrolase [Hyphomicrobiales bacterium]